MVCYSDYLGRVALVAAMPAHQRKSDTKSKSVISDIVLGLLLVLVAVIKLS